MGRIAAARPIAALVGNRAGRKTASRLRAALACLVIATGGPGCSTSGIEVAEPDGEAAADGAVDAPGDVGVPVEDLTVAHKSDLAVADLAMPDLLACNGGKAGSVDCGRVGLCPIGRCFTCVGPFGTASCGEPPDGFCFEILCDGPEDCAAGQYCGVFEGALCVPGPPVGGDTIAVACHLDCDCPAIAPHCERTGTCACHDDKECPPATPSCRNNGCTR